eukprot:5449636-Ditylum_brightwellii.AAC.1
MELNDQVKQKWLEKVKIIRGHTSLFLDMQMEWEDKMLTFSVYAKPNHTIKYVGNMSCHRPAVFKAIPAGVFTRLGRLTSITMETVNQPITTLYPVHTLALTNTRILPTKIPTLKELKAEEILHQQK